MNAGDIAVVDDHGNDLVIVRNEGGAPGRWRLLVLLGDGESAVSLTRRDVDYLIAALRAMQPPDPAPADYR